MKTCFCSVFFVIGGIHAVPAPFVNLGFENLGFEEARTNSLVPDPRISGALWGPITDLLPGWQLSTGNIQVENLGYNSPTTVIHPIEILRDDGIASPVVDRYSLLLIPLGQHYSLTQRGHVPDEARFLSFTYSGYPFIASINGQDVTRSNAPLVGQPVTITGDISRFAGQTVDLTIRTSYPSIPGVGSSYRLYDITFMIPEPSTSALVAFGVVVMVACGLRRCLR